MSSIDEDIKQFEEWEKKALEEFNNRLEIMEDDELKNLLVILRDLILIESGLSTAKSITIQSRLIKVRDEIRKSKDFRDRYL